MLLRLLLQTLTWSAPEPRTIFQHCCVRNSVLDVTTCTPPPDLLASRRSSNQLDEAAVDVRLGSAGV